MKRFETFVKNICSKHGKTKTIILFSIIFVFLFLVSAYSISANSDSVPFYWHGELNSKVADINAAMETAGSNKSSFFWYTDSHWAYNSQVSPRLLKYLYENTAINKTNFGGDIAESHRATPKNCMDGLRKWRKAVRDLPNHHSVKGNHDDNEAGDECPELTTETQQYAFLIAPEETADMVIGDGLYYYIDNHPEKTRYIYLDTSPCTNRKSVGDVEQLKYVVEWLNNVPSGWHIVVLSHIWFRYDDATTPDIGVIPDYCQVLLDIFDAYNSRRSIDSITYENNIISFDFSGCGGYVEFCMGGHTHIDYTIYSTDGIPVILTETDSFHLRSNYSRMRGTTSESSVSAIIADYNLRQISVIRIGRGESRTVPLQNR